jgi:4-amino-4-deoxy-L-arabinose transferase-like glycosyltransferase
MDNDSGHHADIALRMYLTGDYVTLYDHRGDYIDKPHFLFWTSAAELSSFWRYFFCLPAFLLFFLRSSALIPYFVWEKNYMVTEIGKLAALIAASSFCYILANNDVRMDAILTAAIAFATWQLVPYVHHRKFIFLLVLHWEWLLAFLQKGHVGLVTRWPVFSFISYIKGLEAVV